MFDPEYQKRVDDLDRFLQTNTGGANSMLRESLAQAERERDEARADADLADKQRAACLADLRATGLKLAQAMALLNECRNMTEPHTIFSSVHTLPVWMLNKINAFIDGQPAPAVMNAEDYGLYLVLRDLVRDATLAPAAREKLLNFLNRMDV